MTNDPIHIPNLVVPEASDVIVGELAERGEWIVANIETNSFWPVKAQKLSFRGETVWIIPLMTKHYPAVAMKIPAGKSRDQCERLLMQFVSTLSWVEDKGFMVTGIGGGSLPAPMGRDKERGFSIAEEFDLSYFPEPSDPKALLAMALMREGRGLNHPAYAFLSFYRVLEVAIPDGSKRRKWVEASLLGLKGFRVPEALKALAAAGVANIGDHLYASGRCAIAHASAAPIVDPDDPSDYRRLQTEMPIMIALATKAIEDVFDVHTSQTIYNQHLYELAGFKKILGEDTVAHLTRGEQVSDQRSVDIPCIDVRIRKKEPYKALSGMIPRDIRQEGKVLVVQFQSADEAVAIRLDLDFGRERLHFSVFDGVASKPDDGTPEAADNTGDVMQFQGDYFGNGQLQIFDAENGELIARKSAYIPVNMYQDLEATNAGVADFRFLAEFRRDRNRRYGDDLKRQLTGYRVTIAQK